MPAWAGGGRRRCMAIRPAQRWGLWAAHRCQGAAPDTLQAAGSAGTALAQTVPHCAPGREPLLCRPARAITRSMGGLEALGQRIAVAAAGAFRHTPPTRVPARSEWRWSVTPRPRPRPAPVHLSLNPPAPAPASGQAPHQAPPHHGLRPLPRRTASGTACRASHPHPPPTDGLPGQQPPALLRPRPRARTPGAPTAHTASGGRRRAAGAHPRPRQPPRPRAAAGGGGGGHAAAPGGALAEPGAMWLVG